MGMCGGPWKDKRTVVGYTFLYLPLVDVVRLRAPTKEENPPLVSYAIAFCEDSWRFI